MPMHTGPNCREKFPRETCKIGAPRSCSSSRSLGLKSRFSGRHILRMPCNDPTTTQCEAPLRLSAFPTATHRESNSSPFWPTRVLQSSRAVKIDMATKRNQPRSVKKRICRTHACPANAVCKDPGGPIPTPRATLFSSGNIQARRNARCSLLKTKPRKRIRILRGACVALTRGCKGVCGAKELTNSSDNKRDNSCGNREDHRTDTWFKNSNKLGFLVSIFQVVSRDS
jgi:hypothetical protein